jgi:hypothetical protein
MYAVFTLARYRRRYFIMGWWSMLVFHVILRRNKAIAFYKLTGSGKNGSFKGMPDFRRWGILVFFKPEVGFESRPHPPDQVITQCMGSFIGNWLKAYCEECWTVLLEPLTGHGSWDGFSPSFPLEKMPTYEGPVVVLTRATIRVSKYGLFLRQIPTVTKSLQQADGLIVALGIGEWPLLRQGTFSIWESMESLKNFAYGTAIHRNVIQKSRTEKWYREDMFLRLRPVCSSGRMGGINPLSPDTD